MNESYTYGYDNGWNVENEYINSLSEIMKDYNNQVKKIEEINNSIATAEVDAATSIEQIKEETNRFIQSKQDLIMRNNNATYPTFNDEQIRRWYIEDYTSYNTTITFDRYKTNFLKKLELSNNIKKQDIEKEKEELSKQILEKQEYLSKLELEKQLHLSNLKDESKANMRYLIDVKNETKKAILKKKSQITLLLSEKRIELSYISLEQQRTIPQSDDNGNILNSKKLLELRNKYDNTRLEIKKIEHALQKINEMLELMEYSKAENELMMKGLSPKQKEIYGNINDIEIKNDVLKHKSEENIEQTKTVQETEYKTDEESKNLSFEEIIKKVYRGSSFTQSESNKYAATKIKVFNKPQTNNSGLMGKITSIGKSVIGIIPRAAMKLYGKLLDPVTEEMLQVVEKRSMELSDDEVVTILNEYDNNLNVIPEGFEQIVKPRVNLYVSKRVEYLQKEFNKSMYEIALSQQLIEQNEDNQDMKVSYLSGYSNIKGLINIQIEVEKLLKASKFHSFKVQLKSLDNKLVYAGGRFERAKEYDSTLWDKVSGLSQKIEYSLDPKEVVDSYTERENIYKEHDKHKSYLTESDLEKLNNISKKEEKVDPTFKTSEEIRSLIEGLKSMKAELTEQDVKEIEGLLR